MSNVEVAEADIKRYQMLIDQATDPDQIKRYENAKKTLEDALQAISTFNTDDLAYFVEQFRPFTNLDYKVAKFPFHAGRGKVAEEWIISAPDYIKKLNKSLVKGRLIYNKLPSSKQEIDSIGIYDDLPANFDMSLREEDPPNHPWYNLNSLDRTIPGIKESLIGVIDIIIQDQVKPKAAMDMYLAKLNKTKKEGRS